MPFSFRPLSLFCLCLLAADAMADPPLAYQRVEIRNRSRLQAQRGLGEIGGVRYLHFDAEALRRELPIRGAAPGARGAPVLIASPSLARPEGRRELNVRVLAESRGALVVPQTAPGGAERTVRVANPTLEAGGPAQSVSLTTLVNLRALRIE